MPDSAPPFGMRQRGLQLEDWQQSSKQTAFVQAVFGEYADEQAVATQSFDGGMMATVRSVDYQLGATSMSLLRACKSSGLAPTEVDVALQGPDRTSTMRPTDYQWFRSVIPKV